MSPEAPDLTDVEFRLRNARAGVALSVFCGLYLAAYCLATWAQPHRGTILAVAIGAIGGSLAMLAVPLRGILRRPRPREAMFLAWSGVLVALITVVTACDGGVSSPLAAFFFLPPVFAALSYPLLSTVVVVVADIAAYAGTAAVLGGVSSSRELVIALSLTAAAILNPQLLCPRQRVEIYIAACKNDAGAFSDKVDLILNDRRVGNGR